MSAFKESLYEKSLIIFFQFIKKSEQFITQLIMLACVYAVSICYAQNFFIIFCNLSLNPDAEVKEYMKKLKKS